MKKGILIALDGPNASGKSTIISQVVEMLFKDGYSIKTEKEPTDTLLGHFCKDNANDLIGRSLAYIVAADRIEHSKRLVSYINSYDVILLDRYYFSSFIFQAIDGLLKDEIFCINKGIIMPDIQIVLTANKNLLEKRLKTRNEGDRFERNNSNKEIQFTEEAIEYFKTNHKDIQLYVVEASDILKDEKWFENSINVYNIIKERLKNV